MMSVDPKKIFQMLLWAFVCGGGIGIFYDALRLSRVLLGFHYLPERSKIFKNKFFKRFTSESKKNIEKNILFKIILFFEDVLFMIISAVVFVLILFYGNDGKFRLLALMSYFAGFSAYYFTLGKITVLFFDIWATFLRAACRYIVYYLLLPFKLILKKISRFIHKALENIGIKIYNIRERKTLLRLSEKGMFNEKFGL